MVRPDSQASQGRQVRTNTQFPTDIMSQRSDIRSLRTVHPDIYVGARTIQNRKVGNGYLPRLEFDILSTSGFFIEAFSSHFYRGENGRILENIPLKLLEYRRQLLIRNSRWIVLFR